MSQPQSRNRVLTAFGTARHDPQDHEYCGPREEQAVSKLFEEEGPVNQCSLSDNPRGT